MGKQRTIKKPANFDRYLEQEGLITLSEHVAEADARAIIRLRGRVSELQRSEIGLTREASAFRQLSSRRQKKALRAAGYSA